MTKRKATFSCLGYGDYGHKSSPAAVRYRAVSVYLKNVLFYSASAGKVVR